MFCGQWRSGAARWGVIVVAVVIVVSGLRAALPAPAKADDGLPVDGVDLRPIFQNWNLAADLQGTRGTCSVFAVKGALEYALASQQRSGYRLSVEFLNWASNQTVKEAQDGGYFSDLWKGYEAYGICTAEDGPYRSAFDPQLATEHQRDQPRAAVARHWLAAPLDQAVGRRYRAHGVATARHQADAPPTVAGLRRTALAKAGRVDRWRAEDGAAGRRLRWAQRAPGGIPR